MEPASSPTRFDDLSAPCHVFIPYSTDAEYFATAGCYIRNGIEANEKALYVAPESEHAALRAELQKLQVDPISAESSGALTFVGAANSYLRTGEFDPEDMLAFFEKDASDVRHSHFHGYRVFGNWVTAAHPERLPEFESKLNPLSQKHSLSFLCAYNCARMGAPLVREALATHPLVLLGGRLLRNPYYVPPEVFLAEDRPRREVDWFLGNLERSGQDGFGAQQLSKVFARAAVDAEEAVRRATALELHDDLGQILTALHLRLASAVDEGRLLSARELTEDAALVGSAMESVRRLALDLRPSALDDLGLTAALRSLATEQSLRAGFHLELRMPELDASALAPDVALAAFRIVQQAITNVVQHAQAKSVTLTVDVKADVLQLSIRDDGAGFDRAVEAARQNGRLGLRGMTERAALVGGDLQVESSPGFGTVVRARLPMRTERPL